MTQVHIDIKKESSTGVEVPLLVGMAWSPSKLRTVGDTIVVPESFPVTLDYAPVTITVTPSQFPDWVWRVRYWADSTKYDKYLIVPNSASVLEFTDLEEIDPATLSPVVEPEPAWWAYVGNPVQWLSLNPTDTAPLRIWKPSIEEPDAIDGAQDDDLWARLTP